MDKQWFYAIGDKTVGPVTKYDLEQMLSRGEISKDTLIWAEGISEWAPFSSLEETLHKSNHDDESDKDIPINHQELSKGKPVQPAPQKEQDHIVQPYGPEAQKIIECPKCGHVNEPSKKFCPKCGTPISKLLTTTDSIVTPTESTVVEDKSPVESSAVVPPAENQTVEQQSTEKSVEKPDIETIRKELDSLIDEILSTEEFEPKDIEKLKEKSNQIGYTEEQLLIYVEKKLLEKGFIPDPDADIKERATVNETLSVGWKTYEKNLEVSIGKFRNTLDNQLKGVYNPNDYAKIAEFATGFLRRDDFKLRETIVSYLKEKGFKPVGEFEAGNDLTVGWKTGSVIKSKPISLPNSNLKWIVVGIILLVVVAVVSVSLYLFSQKKNERPIVQSQISKNVTPTYGTQDSTRILALDALRCGTDLSVTVSKIPKLKKVVDAAKELGEISPRYQEQVTTAENTLDSALKNRDKDLLAYFGKVVELSRYTPEQISYAMGIISNGDRTLREKKVMELLTKHVDYLRVKNENDPKKLLSDFNIQFNDFVD